MVSQGFVSKQWRLHQFYDSPSVMMLKVYVAQGGLKKCGCYNLWSKVSSRDLKNPSFMVPQICGGWKHLLFALLCRNISVHVLMGRSADRLETMALVFSSYVLVCIVDKRRVLSLYGCNLLILCDDTPVFLTETAY